MTRATGVTRVFFPCTGLGREQRGFEAFTRECAAALATRPEVQLTVFGGGGKLLPSEREAWSLSRSGFLARAVGSLLDRDPYFVEQATFFAGFVGTLISQSPDLVYFADVNLGNACWHWRRLTGARYRLLYYNGGPTTRPFTRCDFVQQVSPEHLTSALERGEPRERQFLLPHGLAIPRAYSPPDAAERAQTRLKLGVPLDAKVILSVGALNIGHKRMDYVIDEVATMASQPHLVLIGAETPEAGIVRERAAQRLGSRCTIRTLRREDLRAVYRASDAFVLASRTEGFGLAQLEALEAGLPCVGHASATTDYVLGREGIQGDLSYAGALAPLLERALAEGFSRARERHDSAYERFSWDVLTPQYVKMLLACAAGRPTPDVPA
jgi:1,2-diacylglycerol 3-alpha-glucosyltransferase